MGRHAMIRILRGSMITLLAAFGVPSAHAQTPPLRIGLSVPLTGPDAAYGLGLRLGAEQAVADLNRAGGATGRKIALVVADDAGDAKQAATVARKFVAEGIRLVVGGFESSVVASATPVLDEAGAAFVATGAGYAPLTGRGWQGLIRLSPSDAQQGTAAGTYLAGRFAGRPTAILHDRTTFGRGLADEVSRELKARGAPEALFEGIAKGSRDTPDLVARLKGAGIEAVYFGGLAQEAAMLVRALREAGSSAILVASDGILDRDFAGIGPAGEGTVMTLPAEPRRLPEVKGAKPMPRTAEAESVAATAYAAVELLARASLRARSMDGRKIAEDLRSGAPTRTLLGDLAVDARGDTRPADLTLRVWRRTPDGRLDYAGNEPAP